MREGFRLSIVALALLVPVRSAAEDVTVFAAASLSECLQEMESGFERSSGHAITFAFGGSSDLARQIRAGAPADVFFSADEAQMDGLEAAGLVRRQDRVNVLSNTLVVVVPIASTLRMTGRTDLAAVGRLALADPRAVPAGVYARRWLESQGLWGALLPRVVPTLDVRAALAAVESGNVDAGVVYRTDAVRSKRARVAFQVARDEGPAIVYPLAPLARSRKPATAAVVRYLTSDAARDAYRRHGFLVLGGE